ncbi:winged helix-turn-helix transcriptional regulator [Veillonella caviae]|uniref:winged helix-turn-helix domain-containing protein n=1 Tax=Veillonella caviae TaxID=248316 RepID=UPI002A91849B|nr:winged helix-turn-helix transcriptional regulator [Veillonella caviae]MDY5787473.1 winged helix-turn-helix transcriptional regulator [Veillonella caviae]
MGNKKSLNSRREKILEEIRNNPNITQVQLAQVIGVGVTTIENNIRFLKENGYIERVGSNKTGYWNVK